MSDDLSPREGPPPGPLGVDGIEESPLEEPPTVPFRESPEAEAETVPWAPAPAPPAPDPDAESAAGPSALRPATEPLAPRAARALDGDSWFPERVGDWRLLRRLGSGGMGVVFLAQSTTGLRRRAAIKLLRPDLVSPQAALRFEAEGQALARLSHPGIARIFSAGRTSDGLAYLAVEYVEGTSIERYCDAHSLSTRARVGLFQQVLHAVAHLHDRGVIHRDIKASNVLVETVDGAPRARLIDFGVMKAITPFEGVELNTVTGTPVGTPQYMSPEQLRGDDVDVRADVYALGVLLFRLLTGRLPFSQPPTAHDLAPRPSTRAAGATAPATAAPPPAVPSGEPAQGPGVRTAELRGDLDRIVLRAAAPDRDARYISVRELAGDVACYLEHRPVQAVEPSPLYVAGKFLRRHLLACAASAAVAIGLVVFLVLGALGWSAERNRRQERYVSLVQAAREEIDANHPRAARALLDQCPEELRAVEWRFLRHEAAEPDGTVSGMVYDIEPAADGDGFLVCASGLWRWRRGRLEPLLDLASGRGPAPPGGGRRPPAGILWCAPDLSRALTWSGHGSMIGELRELRPAPAGGTSRRTLGRTLWRASNCYGAPTCRGDAQGRFLICPTLGDAPRLHFLDARDGTALDAVSPPAGAQLSDAAISGDGSTVAMHWARANRRGLSIHGVTLYRASAAGLEEGSERVFHEGVRRVSLDSGGGRVAVQAEGATYLFDVDAFATGPPRQRLDESTGPLVFVPDSGVARTDLLAGALRGVPVLIDADSGLQLARAPGLEEDVLSIVFDARGETALAGDDTGGVRLLAPRSGATAAARCVWQVIADVGGSVRRSDLFADGTLVLTMRDDPSGEQRLLPLRSSASGSPPRDRRSDTADGPAPLFAVALAGDRHAEAREALALVEVVVPPRGVVAVAQGGQLSLGAITGRWVIPGRESSPSSPAAGGGAGDRTPGHVDPAPVVPDPADPAPVDLGLVALRGAADPSGRWLVFSGPRPVSGGPVSGGPVSPQGAAASSRSPRSAGERLRSDSDPEHFAVLVELSAEALDVSLAGRAAADARRGATPVPDGLDGLARRGGPADAELLRFREPAPTRLEVRGTVGPLPGPPSVLALWSRPGRARPSLLIAVRDELFIGEPGASACSPARLLFTAPEPILRAVGGPRGELVAVSSATRWCIVTTTGEVSEIPGVMSHGEGFWTAAGDRLLVSTVHGVHSWSIDRGRKTAFFRSPAQLRTRRIAGGPQLHSFPGWDDGILVVGMDGVIRRWRSAASGSRR